MSGIAALLLMYLNEEVSISIKIGDFFIVFSTLGCVLGFSCSSQRQQIFYARLINNFCVAFMHWLFRLFCSGSSEAPTSL